MKPARTVTHIEVPYSWSNVTNGEWAAQLLQARIDEWCPKLFGYHMLKLGGLSAELTSHHCNIQHQISVDKFSSYRNVEAESFELPFVEKSFDACLLIHQLDYSTDPHRLLREVDRITVDDGYLLLSGNNPLSVTGFCGLLPWNRNKAPWNGRMYLSSRVIDWLRLLNYEVIYHETLWLNMALACLYLCVGLLFFALLVIIIVILMGYTKMCGFMSDRGNKSNSDLTEPPVLSIGDIKE